MQIWRSLEEITHPPANAVLTIGNFDGLHRGHRHVIDLLRKTAAQVNGAAVALTFDPHPSRVLAPQRASLLLTPMPERIRLLEAAGLDALFVLPFTKELAAWPPEEFVQRVMVERLKIKEVLVGGNFRFGYRQAGNVDLLWQLGAQAGFAVQVIDPIQVRGGLVSSTRIRSLITQGRVSLAARLLGRSYEITGPIVPGRGIGRKQAVPTYNLAPYPELLPKRGVYITTTNGVPSVTNIGHNPTFGETELHLESHLLEDPGAPATEMRVAFHFRIRDEVKFPSPEALRTRIGKDISKARRYFETTDKHR